MEMFIFWEMIMLFGRKKCICVRDVYVIFMK